MNVEKLQIAGEDLMDLFGVCRHFQFGNLLRHVAPYRLDTHNYGRFARNVGAKIFVWPMLSATPPI